ncbi:hypothetical protein B6N60_04311 [Richelia sinica FACHB-800]|uniref:Uncharacterized protein n=1 Tax=Richelia sinica FACHB-800 TaxID=1357546 RepID=A0A975Y6S6_9NOST|nr:hypothetical protein B6N60_04311 [Richelia sinica FACHB-800]
MNFKLMLLLSKANLQAFYHRPEITPKLLKPILIK